MQHSAQRLAYVRVKSNRILPDSDALAALRIKREGRKLWACLTYKIEAAGHDDAILPIRLYRGVGIDMGVSVRAALSDGPRIERIRIDRRRRRRLQRRLSRARKGSYSRGASGRIARVRGRIALQTQATHRATTAIVRRYDFIAFEDLRIRNMTKSARGTVEEPGKNVSQKRGLNREILEQSWGRFQSQLAYKAEWAGKAPRCVRPHYTSQTCGGCGVVDGSQRKGKRYDCGRCGLSVDADRNAAINILRRAIDDGAARVGTGSREMSGAAHGM